MDENRQDEVLNESETIEETEVLSEEELRLKQEMEALARTFQEELDKAKAEEAQLALEKQEAEEEAEILIQELEPETDGENIDDIPEEELCECCGEKRRGTKSNPDSPYCPSCEKALRRYPFDLLSVLLVLIVVGFSFYTCICFADRTELYANSLQAKRYESNAKPASAYTSNAKAIEIMEKNKINGELVYKRAVETMFKLGSTEEISNYEDRFKTWEIKLPHLRKAYDVFKTNEEMTATQDKIYSLVAEIAGNEITNPADLPYDEVMAKLDELENAQIVREPVEVDTENGEEFVTSAYRNSAQTYNTSMINFFRFYFSAVCEKDYETQIKYLEKIKEDTPEYTWLYDSMLGDLYNKTGKDVTEYCDFLLKYNSENPVVYVIKTTSLRIQGKYDEAIELAQKYIDRNDTYAYEFLRQQALCYLMKGEYKNAYDAANSSYGLYGNTLQSVDTLALCSIASNNMSTYDELAKLLEENEVQFSDEVTAYKNGTLTLEDILTKGDFDVQ
ncbi:MAG TPA: hypothetical protein DCR23_06755 [Ruminococcaceae bacterium]|nr:hypothetical protein [Oscillospiraceae bacterium]